MSSGSRRPTADDKFAFIMSSAWPVRILYAAGIAAWIGVIAGYVLFFRLNAWYWVIFGPFLAIFTAYHLLTYGINLFYRPFDAKVHYRKVRAFWQKAERAPTVDIFIPVCGEDAHILTETFAAVNDIAYDDASKRVFVLDDRGETDVRRLAEKMGFTYFSRPDKGNMKKAGNLKYGLSRTDGEFVVVFDADFAPHKDFLKELLPYMADERVGIVQSPQHFRTDDDVHRRSGLEYGAGQTQEDFYRVIQVARDRFGAAICVGSNAIYRRSALDEIGGVPQIDHSEDVHLGFDMVASGRRIAYVPLVLATGVCPSDVHSYFHQQHRWCSGSMSLWLSEKFRKAPLTLAQRLCYWSGILYYVTHALSLVMAFQIFVVLFLHFDAISWVYALPFLPHLVFSFVMLPLFRTSRPRFGTMLVRAAHAYSYTHSVVSNVIRGPMNWHPTNARHSGVSAAFLALVAFNAAYILLYAVFVAYALATGRLPLLDADRFPVVFWVWYFFLTNGVFLWHSAKTLRAAEQRTGVPARGRALHTAGGAYIAALLVMLGSGAYIGSIAPSVPVTVVAPVVETTAIASPDAATVDAAKENAAVHSTPREIIDVELAATSTDARATTRYAESAEPGDSITVLHRRIISSYCLDLALDVAPAERTFMETVLTARDGRTGIEVGDIAIADASGLAALLDDARALDREELDRWEVHSRNVVFDEACIGNGKPLSDRSISAAIR